MKYDISVNQLSENGFKDTIVFSYLDFASCINIMQCFQNCYDYTCEYKIKKSETKIEI